MRKIEVMVASKGAGGNIYAILGCVQRAMRKAIFNKVFVNPMTALSNIGIISEDIVNYGNIKVNDFFVTGAIKYSPYVLLSLFTFRSKLTFSIAMEGSEHDFDNAQKLLDILKYYLKLTVTMGCKRSLSSVCSCDDTIKS